MSCYYGDVFKSGYTLILKVLNTTIRVLNFVSKTFVVCQACKCIKFHGYNFRGLISTSQFIFSRIR